MQWQRLDRLTIQKGVNQPWIREYVQMDKNRQSDAYLFVFIGVPKGSRTPVTGVKGQCPRPLDDGDRFALRVWTGRARSQSEGEI